MLVFISFFVNLLYSQEFLAANDMIKWLLIGSFIKAGSWSISFVFLAKGNTKIFLFNELGISCVTILSYMGGYYFFGLDGLGYAFTFIYTLYFLWVAIVADKMYKIKYTSIFWKIFFGLLMAILIFPIGEFFWNAKYKTGCLLIAIISFYCLYELNRKIGLRSVFNYRRK